MKRTFDTRKAVIAIFFTSVGFLSVLLVALGRWLDGLLRLPTLSVGAANLVAGTLLSLIGAGLVVWSVYVQFVIGKGTPAPSVATQRTEYLDYKGRTPFLLACTRKKIS